MRKHFIKRRLIESDDEDSADFMRELRQVNPETVRAFLDEHLIYDPEAKVWKLLEYTDYTGTTADRANARFLIKNYPVIVPNTGPHFNTVVIGIPEAALGQLDSEMAASLFEQIKKLKTSGLLDEEEYRAVETIKRNEAWKHHYRQEFVNALKQKFPQIDEEYIDEERLRGLFEDARDISGAEWSEDTGAGQIVDTSGIAEKITPEMIHEWLFPDQGGVDAQIESIMEGRKFSCVMAPASPDIVDAVRAFSRMFITDDKLYKDPEDPEGFGREDEVHVTVKFGLHEKEPSPDLLKIIEQTEPFEIEIGSVSLFENEKFDVVKFDISGEGLFKLNARISGELECTDTYPEYHPHMTVAYITKGTCREMVGKKLLQPDEKTSARFLVKSVIFSSLTSAKTRLFLGKPNIEMEQMLEAVNGEEIANRLMEIGTAQGGFIPSTLNAIRARQFQPQKLDVREFLKTDQDFAEYVESYAPRSYEEDGGLKSLEGSEEQLEPENLYEEPIVVIDGVIRDGWSRAADHLQKQDFEIQAWVSNHAPMGEAEQQSAAVTNKGPETVAKPSLSHYTTNKAPGTNEATPWTKEQAETWLSSIRPALEAVGYDAKIVGSVDRHGESEKDLDILLTPMGDGHNVAAAMFVLAEHSKWWGRADEDLFNAVLPDGHIVEFWFSGLQSLLDDEIYNDEATKLPKGSLYHGKLVQEGFDDEEESQSAKDVQGEGSFRQFTDTDIENHGVVSGAAIIYTNDFRKELLDAPTDWQKQGLHQTSSGYGSKLMTRYKIAFNGRLYRVYSTNYGNSGSMWFMVRGRKIFIH